MAAEASPKQQRPSRESEQEFPTFQVALFVLRLSSFIYRVLDREGTRFTPPNIEARPLSR